MSRGRPNQRGVAVVAVVVLLVVLGLIIVGMLAGGAHDQDLSRRRMETVQAFYAAEAGVNMAMRELIRGTDEDGDGHPGTISDDAVPGNDPGIGSGQVVVTASVLSGTLTLRSEGRDGTASRVAESGVVEREE